ncbi:unnamed protein product, partial [Prorocentrum cordatum]
VLRRARAREASQGRAVLHWATHGAQGPPAVLLEDGRGEGHWRGPQWLRQLLGSTEGAGCGLELCFLSFCYGEAFGLEFRRAGCPYVVCQRAGVRDRTANRFTDAFYKSLAEGDGVPKAFKVAREVLLVSGNDWALVREAHNYLLLHAHDESHSDELAEPAPDLARQNSGRSTSPSTPCRLPSLPEHALQPGSGEEALMGVTAAFNWREPSDSGIEDYVGGEEDLVRLLSLFEAGRRCVCVTGKPGIGKTSLVKQLITYSQMYGRTFDHAAVYVSCSDAPCAPPPCDEECSEGRALTELAPAAAPCLPGLVARAAADVAGQAAQQSQSQAWAWSRGQGTDAQESAVLRDAMDELERRAKSNGRFVLVALDDVAAVHREDRRLLERLLNDYHRLRVLFVMREEWTGGDLAGHKVVTMNLRGLSHDYAARLFVRRVHRRLKSDDFPDFPEYLRAAFNKTPSSSEEAEKQCEYAQKQLQRHPVLMQCDGNPAAIRDKASCVTGGLATLMDLLEA